MARPAPWRRSTATSRSPPAQEGGGTVAQEEGNGASGAGGRPLPGRHKRAPAKARLRARVRCATPHSASTQGKQPRQSARMLVECPSTSGLLHLVWSLSLWSGPWSMLCPGGSFLELELGGGKDAERGHFLRRLGSPDARQPRLAAQQEYERTARGAQFAWYQRLE